MNALGWLLMPVLNKPLYRVFLISVHGEAIILQSDVRKKLEDVPVISKMLGTTQDIALMAYSRWCQHSK